jgi:hypothetical protein
MPWLFEAKKALTVAVRAPLPTYRDRPPSLAHVERPGNEGRYGPVGESTGWVETPNLSLGDIHNSWEARARLFHDLHISWQPLRRWRGVVPAILKVAPIITPQQAVVLTATIFPVSRLT